MMLIKRVMRYKKKEEEEEEEQKEKEEDQEDQEDQHEKLSNKEEDEEEEEEKEEEENIPPMVVKNRVVEVEGQRKENQRQTREEEEEEEEGRKIEEGTQFTCAECHEYIQYNLECQSCHTFFCKGCIAERTAEVKKSNKQGFTIYKMTCPQCHEETPTMMHNEAVQRLVNDIKIRCNQCACSVKVGEMALHLKHVCRTPCRMQMYGCDFVGTASKHRIHEKTCPLIKVEGTLKAYKEAAEAAQGQAQENYEQMYHYMCEADTLKKKLEEEEKERRDKEMEMKEAEQDVSELKRIIANSADVIQKLIQHGTFPPKFFAMLKIELQHEHRAMRTPESPYTEEPLYDTEEILSDEGSTQTDPPPFMEEEETTDDTLSFAENLEDIGPPPSYHDATKTTNHMTGMSPMDQPPFFLQNP